ncbi:hypothetical protein [Streptomyces sp. NBC_01431]|uniref:hypothetical protein n=1 Tax=Streptomyces sp. NBC_01431 TaxID=2903863 RepID=UPI002E322912|nr:hypothetical protein [Streptomyces sp. NBC_01431]
MANDGTAGRPAQHQPAISVRRRHAEGRLAWCQFAFSVICVIGGVALCLTGNPGAGIPLIGVGAWSQVRVVINLR